MSQFGISDRHSFVQLLPRDPILHCLYQQRRLLELDEVPAIRDIASLELTCLEMFREIFEQKWR